MKVPTVSLFAVVFCAFVCSRVSAQSAPAGQAHAANGIDDGVTVSGQTVDTFGQPLRKTTLTMRPAKPDSTGVNPSPYGATSGADGTFEFKVTPGSYVLTAQHTGYLTARYGGTKPTSPGVTLNVVAGQAMTDLRVALTPASTVTGKVFDEDGDPVARVSVQLLRSVYRSGARGLAPAGSASSDADGMYKIQNVSPGKYYLSARPPSGGMAGLSGFSRTRGSGVVPKESAEPDQQYVTAFYPNVRDAASAVLLEVRPGQDLQGMDLHLRKTSVFHVRGKVTGAIPGRSAREISVALMADAGPGASIGIGIGSPQATNISADGTFDIAGIAPGAYSLLAVTNYGTIVTLAQQTIAVVARDLQDLVLELRPLGQLTGHVTTETPTEAVSAGNGSQGKAANNATNNSADGSANSPVTRSPTITLQPVATITGSFSAKVAGDGSFSISEIPPGSYTLTVSGLPGGTWARAIMRGGTDVLDTGLDIGSGDSGSPIDVRLRQSSAGISGSVQDENGQAAPGASVVVIPDTNSANRLWMLSRLVSTDQSGQFSFDSLAPGAYRVYAWGDIEPGAGFDPEFVKPYESKSAKVTLKENDVQTISLTRIVPADN